MRSFALVLASLSLAAGCMAEAPDSMDEGWNGDGKADGSPNVKWDESIANIVPKNVHEYLEKYQWGDYHIVFHMTRKWFLLGDNSRGWLKRVGEAASDLQEGDPGNGVEFLTMHRAMIEHLTERWGDEKVTNDPEGRADFAAVLQGWTTDEEVIAGLASRGCDVETFKRGLVKINDFGSFATEDEFGTFIQTSLRLTGEVDPEDSAKRFYSRDMTPGTGVHNWLHGQLMDSSSPIDVGNPQTNLSNIMFWRIHGWIEAKWQAFEQVHQRTPLEMNTFQDSMERFHLHMQLHSDFSETSHAVNRPSKTVVNDVKQVLFANQADCSRLAEGTHTDNCPE